MVEDKPHLAEKIAYGAGDFAFCLYWQMFSMFLLYFYTDIFGVAAATVGWMLLVTRLWDTVNDPLMGIIADRTNTRWGKFRPYLFWFAIPMGLVGVLTFSTPDLSPTGRVIYMYVTYCLMMMVYTAINVPYAAMLGVMTSNPHEKTSFATFRMVGAQLGSMLVQATMIGLVAYFGGENEKLGYQYAVAAFAVLGAVLFLLCFAGTNERVQPMKSRSPVTADFGDLFTNGPWLVLFLVSFLLFVSISVRGASILYYFKYYVGSEGWAAAYMTGGSIAAIAGMVLLKPVSVRLGKRNALVLLLGGYSVASAVMYHLGPGQTSLIFGSYFLASFLFGPMMPLLWSMYADTADYSEWKTGRRSTGLLFSASSSSQKFGWALAGSIAAWALGFVGFEANQDQTPETLNGIRMLMGYVPAGLGLAAAGLTLLYTLDQVKQDEITTALGERRAVGPASAIPPVEPSAQPAAC
ncbi:MAG: MFS transporter [Planctomycetota bacterium]